MVLLLDIWRRQILYLLLLLLFTPSQCLFFAIILPATLQQSMMCPFFQCPCAICQSTTGCSHIFVYEDPPASIFVSGLVVFYVYHVLSVESDNYISLLGLPISVHLGSKAMAPFDLVSGHWHFHVIVDNIGANVSNFSSKSLFRKHFKAVQV